MLTESLPSEHSLLTVCTGFDKNVKHRTELTRVASAPHVEMQHFLLDPTQSRLWGSMLHGKKKQNAIYGGHTCVCVYVCVCVCERERGRASVPTPVTEHPVHWVSLEICSLTHKKPILKKINLRGNNAAYKNFSLYLLIYFSGENASTFLRHIRTEGSSCIKMEGTYSLKIESEVITLGRGLAAITAACRH
jgi:hypothetical protein